jgi:hypothetical protein
MARSVMCSFSPHVIRMNKLRRAGWAGHVARMVEMRMYTKGWSENPKERDQLKNLGVSGRIILKWIA